MSLPFPYPAYGYLYDSNGDTVSSGTIALTSGTSTLSVTSNSGGKYIGNLMNYAYSGCTMNLSSVVDGEMASESFKLVISDRAKNLNVTLTEANLPNNISLNTFKNYGNEVYIFNNWDEEGHLKTSDY